MCILHPKIIQRLALLGWLWLALLTGSTTACNCGGTPTPGPTTIQFVGVTQKSFNALQDEDPQTPGFQLTLRGKAENAPENSKVTLTTNGGTPAEINLTGTEFSFQRYTLVEGANILQLKLTASNGQTYLSDALNVTVDSQCFKIKIDKPVNGDIFGPRNDDNTETPGVQTTIEVLVEPPPAPGEDVELTLDNGKGSPQTQSAPVLAGKATFAKLTLPDGDVTLTAKITDKAGNSCQNQIKIQVVNSAPTVVIDTPTNNKLLCPPDDLDPQTDGFQLQVDASTNARDGSNANLLLDGLPFAGPNKVSNGKASFRVTLTAINALLQHTLKATVKDTLENFGESAESKVQVRTRGYSLSIASLLDGQKIPASRDEDPKTLGVQITVYIDSSAPNDTDIKLMFNGQESTQKTANGRAKFLLTLVEGQSNSLQASVLEPSCNLKTDSGLIKIIVEEQGVPAASCKLLKGPAFDNTNTASISINDDTDPQSPGVQNGLLCTTDAELGQPAELTLNGQAQTKNLVDGTAGIRNVEFAGLTFQEGENKISFKVTNKNQKSTTIQYTVLIDTTAPTAISDLKAEVVDPRKASFKLMWSHSQDSGSNPSGILRYEVRWLKGDGPINDSNWANITDFQQSNIVGTAGQPADLTVDKFRIGQKYTLAVRAIDRAGNLSPISNNVSITAAFKQQTITGLGPSTGLFGQAVAVVGDIDKDGLLDLVVTNSSDSDPAKLRTGAVYIFYGRPTSTGSPFPSTPDATLYGEDGYRIGQSVVGVGDLNNDGFDDFAVGAAIADSNKGRVYIVFGGPRNSIPTGNIDAVSRVIIKGNGLFGQSLAVAGLGGIPDINGDTRPDLVVASPTEAIPNSTAKGRTYIFFGRNTYPAAPNKLILTKGDATFEDLRIDNDTLPTATLSMLLVRLADLNGDKQADLILASPYGAQVSIFYGPLMATPTTKELKTSQATLTIQGLAASSRFGQHISVIGDINKDGAPELVIIDDTRVSPQNATCGAAFLYSGQKLNQRKNLQESDAEIVYYSTNGARISAATAAGDVDGDGYADFLIGDGLSDTPQSNAGSAHLFFGNTFNNLKGGDLSTEANITWRGNASNVGLGRYSLLGNFDINNDGFPDILLVETGTDAKGNLYVMY